MADNNEKKNFNDYWEELKSVGKRIKANKKNNDVTKEEILRIVENLYTSFLDVPASELNGAKQRLGNITSQFKGFFKGNEADEVNKKITEFQNAMKNAVAKREAAAKENNTKQNAEVEKGAAEKENANTTNTETKAGNGFTTSTANYTPNFQTSSTTYTSQFSNNPYNQNSSKTNESAGKVSETSLAPTKNQTTEAENQAKKTAETGLTPTTNQDDDIIEVEVEEVKPTNMNTNTNYWYQSYRNHPGFSPASVSMSGNLNQNPFKNMSATGNLNQNPFNEMNTGTPLQSEQKPVKGELEAKQPEKQQEQQPIQTEEQKPAQTVELSAEERDKILNDIRSSQAEAGYIADIDYKMKKKDVQNIMSHGDYDASTRAAQFLGPDQLLAGYSDIIENNKNVDDNTKKAYLETIQASLSELNDESINPSSAFAYLTLADKIKDFDPKMYDQVCNKIATAMKTYDNEHFNENLTGKDMNKNYLDAQEALKDKYKLDENNNSTLLEGYEFTDDDKSPLSAKEEKKVKQSILDMAREMTAEELSQHPEKDHDELMKTNVDKLLAPNAEEGKDGKKTLTKGAVIGNIAAQHTHCEQFRDRVIQRHDHMFGSSLSMFLHKIDKSLTDRFGKKYTQAKKFTKVIAKVGWSAAKSAAMFTVAGAVPFGVPALMAYQTYKKWKAVKPQIMDKNTSKAKKAAILLGEAATSLLSVTAAAAGCAGSMEALGLADNIPDFMHTAQSLRAAVGIPARAGISAVAMAIPNMIEKRELAKKAKETQETINRLAKNPNELVEIKNKELAEIGKNLAEKSKSAAEFQNSMDNHFFKRLNPFNHLKLNKMNKELAQLQEKQLEVQQRPATMQDFVRQQKQISIKQQLANDSMLQSALNTAVGVGVGGVTSELLGSLAQDNQETAEAKTQGNPETAYQKIDLRTGEAVSSLNPELGEQLMQNGALDVEKVDLTAQNESSEPMTTAYERTDFKTGEVSSIHPDDAEKLMANGTPGIEKVDIQEETKMEAKTPEDKGPDFVERHTEDLSELANKDGLESLDSKENDEGKSEAKTPEDGKESAENTAKEGTELSAADEAKANLDEAKNTMVGGKSVYDMTKMHLITLGDSRVDVEDMTKDMAEQLGDDAYKATVACKMAPYALQEKLGLDLPDGQNPTSYNMLKYISENGIPEDKQAEFDKFLEQNFDNNHFRTENFDDYKQVTEPQPTHQQAQTMAHIDRETANVLQGRMNDLNNAINPDGKIISRDENGNYSVRAEDAGKLFNMGKQQGQVAPEPVQQTPVYNEPVYGGYNQNAGVMLGMTIDPRLQGNVMMAPPEFTEKMDHARFSGAYQTLTSHVEYDHGQPYQVVEKGPIHFIPHNPNEKIESYSDYRSARESMNNGVGVFSRNEHDPRNIAHNCYGSGVINRGYNSAFDKVAFSIRTVQDVVNTGAQIAYNVKAMNGKI